MKKQRKNVQFDFFRPYYLTQNEDGTYVESIYDLSALLKHISSNPLINTKRKILGDNHLFHICRKSEDSNMWEIQILHLREQVLPGIADEAGEYELIRLENDQYPAESTTIVYDQEKYILYVQRNIYGTSIRALTGLLELISPEDTHIALKPLIQHSQINKVTSAKLFRKIILSVDSEQLTTKETNSSLGKIISAFSTYQGRLVTIELGFGHMKRQHLNSAKTVQLLKEAYNFSGTDKLRVSIMESEDSKVENVDLLDDRKKYIIPMEYTRENPITHDKLYAKCLSKIKDDIE